jgi:hypothetical protein
MSVNINDWYKVIEKWEGVCLGADEHGGDDCQFCEKFNIAFEDTCQGCPIEEYVGMHSCATTPYDYWCDVATIRVHNKNSQEAADNMLEWLNCRFEEWLTEW